MLLRDSVGLIPYIGLEIAAVTSLKSKVEANIVS